MNMGDEQDIFHERIMRPVGKDKTVFAPHSPAALPLRARNASRPRPKLPRGGARFVKPSPAREGGSKQSELTDEVARKMRSEASIFGLLGQSLASEM